jgi:hypothetical protein
MMAIIASYILNDNWFTSAAHSMIAIDALVKLNLTQLNLTQPGVAQTRGGYRLSC